MFKPLLDFAKDTLGKKVEKVSISKHLVQSPVVVLSADYGWTAQMEKVMKSQAFADQSKFEFMKSKRMFEINPRHPMVVEARRRAAANKHAPRSLVWFTVRAASRAPFDGCALSALSASLTRV